MRGHSTAGVATPPQRRGGQLRARGLAEKSAGPCPASGAKANAATPQRLKHKRTEWNSVDSSTRHQVRTYNVAFSPTRIKMDYVVIT